MNKDEARSIAQQRASEKAQSVPNPNESRNPTRRSPTRRADLMSYEELVQGHRTAIVKTTSGKAFEIQSLSPGEYVSMIGSPITKRLADAGIDVTDGNTASARLRQLPPDELVSLVSDAGVLDLAQHIVCKGVISINFVMKPQHECDPARKEVSIDRLSIPELGELEAAIVQLGESDEDVEFVQLFREGGQEAEAERADDTQDGTDIRPEAERDTVPG
jgi:hypothetical protein